MRSHDTSLHLRRTRTYVVLLLVIAFVFLYLRTFLLPATPLVAYGDEVHYFLHAVRMLHGQIPYRDYFTFVLPGTDLLYAGVFGVLGVHQWVAQACIVVLGLLLTGVITWVASSILRGPLVALPGLLFLVFDFDSALDATHHWWSTLFVLAAAGVLLGGGGYRRVAAAGGLCGVAGLFTQTQGGLGLLAIAAYLIWAAGEGRPGSLRLRQAAVLVLSFAVMVASVVGYYAHQIGARAIAYWTIYFPLVYFPTIEAHTPRAYFLGMPRPHGLGDLLIAIPYVFIHLIVPLVYLLCIFRLVRARKSMERGIWEKVLLINVVGLAMFASVVSAPTSLRLCVVAPPAVILCVWFFSRATRVDRWVRIALWSAAVILVLYLPVNRQRHARSYLDMPTGRAAFLNPRQYETTQWFADHTHAGESFFDSPGVTFALSLESAGPLDYVTTGEFTRPEQVEVLLRSLEDHQTHLIFLYPELYGPRQSGDNLEPFREYVYRNYHLAKVFPSGQVWERN